MKEIPLDINYFSSSDSLKFPDGKPMWQKKRISSILEDKYIENMISDNKVDIVISSSTLSSLIDIYDSWEIPIKIISLSTQCKDSTDQSSRKIVYLDKPLLKIKMTPREMSNYFYNIAFRTISLQHPSISRPISFDKSKYKYGNISHSIGEDTQSNNQSNHSNNQFTHSNNQSTHSNNQSTHSNNQSTHSNAQTFSTNSSNNCLRAKNNN